MRNPKSVHEGKQYPCEQCDYKAASTDNLTKHYHSVHKGETSYGSATFKDIIINTSINNPSNQVDGPADSNIWYEFKVEAHETCTHEDVLESIEANFLGCLDDEKVDKDAPVRDLVVRESKEIKMGRISDSIK